jgi:hypothetical protein
MPGVAGRRALVKVIGAAVAFVTDATTDAGDHLTYQITNPIKRIWDPTLAVLVYVGGVLQASTLYTLDRLTGRIIFKVSQGAGVVTVSGSYRPTSIAVRGKGYSWSLQATLADDNDYDQVNTDNGFQRKVQTVLDVSGTVMAKFSADGYFRDALLADSLVVVEFFPDRNSTHDLVCWGRMTKHDVQIALESLHERSVEFQGAVDADGRAASR